MTSSDGPQPFEMPATGLRFEEAIAFGWHQFKRDPGGWIGLQLITAALSLVVVVPVFLVTTDWQSEVIYDRDPLSLVGNVVASILLGVTSAALVKAALLQMSGGQPAPRPSLSVIREPQVWVLSVIIAVLSEAADYVAYGLSFVVIILTAYAWMYVIDAGQDAWSAIRSGFGLVRRNLAGNLVLFFGAGFVFAAGFVACFIGLFVSIPVVTLAYVYAYRVLASPTIA